MQLLQVGLRGGSPRGQRYSQMPSIVQVLPAGHSAVSWQEVTPVSTARVMAEESRRGELHVGGGSGGGSIIPDCTNFTPSNNAPNADFTCNDWTSKEASGSPWCGHSWPRQGSGLSWMSAAKDGGCARCVKLTEMGGVSSACVGSAGGYGGFYCFEYKP